MTYKAFFWVRAVLAVLLLLYAGDTIYRFANVGSRKGVWEIVFWTLGPPL